MQYKKPVSVLVVIYTAVPSTGLGAGIEVLLLERADHPGYWQSVTGSQDEGEALRETAVREALEETGLDARLHQLTDWQVQNVYEIYPVWRHRYPPGITHNTEHVFGLELPGMLSVQISPREHLSYMWLPWREAAEKVFSPSNRTAILQLPERAGASRH
ncbi:MAG: dihydroneopterin triphosphate diphosphatase [Nitrosomonadales bacterium]|nr:dihydroneopterin triphosphate diphosphatase [Nitrosomonadales bacterium]